jgi:FHA domain
MKDAAYVLAISGRTVPVRRTVVVGRSPDCDVVLLSDHEVSRRHAQFTRTPDGVVVEDLGSTNGTFVGPDRVDGRRLLRVGEIVRVGASGCRVAFQPLHELLTPWEENTPAFGIRRNSPPPPAPEPTRPADIFDVLERITLRELEAGNLNEAETVCSSHLRKLLAEAQAQEGLGESRKHIESALRIAALLALRIKNERWVNYLVALQAATQRPPSEEMAAVVSSAVTANRGVDMVLLAEYCETVGVMRSQLTAPQSVALQRLRLLLPRTGTTDPQGLAPESAMNDAGSERNSLNRSLS